MKKTPFLLVIAAAALFFQSCKHAATSGLIIPKDASMVVYIDGASLNSKLSWNDIKSSDWFKKQYESETDDYKKKLMDDPEASGIDIKSDFSYFMKREGTGSYFSFEGKLKDASAFEAFTTKVEKNKKVEKDGDLNFIKMDQSSVLLWNKSMFMILANGGGIMNKRQTFLQGMDNNNPETPLTADTLVQIAKTLLNLSNDKLLNDDDRFTSLLKETGDIHFWVSNDPFSSPSNGMLSMLKIGDLLKGNISAVTLNFENGKVSLKSKTFLSKDLADFLNNHKPEPVNADAINQIPFQDVSVALATKISPQGLQALMKLSGLDGIVNAQLSKYKLSIDDLVNAFKGEMIMAVSNVTIQEKEHTLEGTQFSYKSKEPDANYFAAIAVNNKTSFQKFLDLGKDQLDEIAKSGRINYKLTDNWFVVSNTTETADKFLAGGNNHLPFAGRISGHPFGMYIDLQKLSGLSSMMGRSTDTASKAPVWQDVVITGGEYKDGALLSTMEVNLFDKSTNSLKQVFNYASGMFNRFSNDENMFKKDQVLMNDNSDTTTSNTTDPSMLQTETDKKNTPKK